MSMNKLKTLEVLRNFAAFRKGDWKCIQDNDLVSEALNNAALIIEDLIDKENALKRKENGTAVIH